MSADRERRLADLLRLSHEVGSPALRMAILGEGNTSLRLDDETFAVKASGCSLGTLAPDGLTSCRFDRLLPLLDRDGMSDAEVDQALLDARTDPSARKPSVEALFHAWLLTLPGVEAVGHCHAIAVNQVLCSPRAGEFARRRIFPDEIVCCGTESILVPYVDPGLALAQAIRRETLALVGRTGRPPRVILLANHGIIAVGPNPSSVLASLQMAEKAAAILVGAAALGGPVFLDPAQVERIAGRPDEHYRQKMLNL
jgi:rhamnose utilization protein RhaD (predicted bifunctional aldolase and dehydrogenase)